MTQTTVCFRISRYQPPAIDPARWDEFRVRPTDGMTILDGLEQIRAEQDPTLAYRHSCHHSSCGTCAIRINGRPKLACTTRVADVEIHPIVLEPLTRLPRVADLVVDMELFFEPIEATWSYSNNGTRLAQCIECGCCVSACPEMREENVFTGPAALAAAEREITITPDRTHDLLLTTAGPDGVAACQRHFACNRVCPTQVAPGTAIARLRQSLDRLPTE